MKTSMQWWNETKGDPEKLIHWLKQQYHGEVTAAKRIKELFLAPGNTLTNKQASIILRICKEEEIHAKWIKEILSHYGVTAEVLQKEERYWNAVLTEEAKQSTESLAAVAHLAEAMRLERISVIASDAYSPKIIRNVFKRILPMELKHTEWFKSLTTTEHIHKALPNHYDGKNALGLIV